MPRFAIVLVALSSVITPAVLAVTVAAATVVLAFCVTALLTLPAKPIFTVPPAAVRLLSVTVVAF